MSIPITVVSGFLGAGNTSLINHVLAGTKLAAEEKGSELVLIGRDLNPLMIRAAFQIVQDASKEDPFAS